jgi:hypothetical protein
MKSLLLLLFLNTLGVAQGQSVKPSAPRPARSQAKPTASTPINRRLKHELDSIYVLDQLYRVILMDPTKSRQRDSVVRARHLPADHPNVALIQLLGQTDSSNLRRVRVLIARYGYPGKTLVGTPTNVAAFYVIQHSTHIPQYLPLIEQAAARGELPFVEYAKMLDRHLMNEQKAQRYGSGGKGYRVLNPATGQVEQKYFVWPVQDPAHVNERRRKAGFDETVEAFAKRIGCEYQALTLDQARELLTQQPK